MKEVKMTEVNTSTTTAILSEEAAREAMRAAFYDTSVESQAEQSVLIDVVQLLALGEVSYVQWAATAMALAKSRNNYSIGQVFDKVTKSQLEYGKAVEAAVKSLKPESVVTKAIEYTGAYYKTRQQIVINSELKVDKQGRQYYEYLSRAHNVTTNSFGTDVAYDTKNGTPRRLKLYVKGGNNFAILERGQEVKVSLGATDTYDEIYNLVLAAGNVDQLLNALRDIPQDVIEELSENQQVQFYTAFKAIKGNLTK
jgi:hypothetical protein